MSHLAVVMEQVCVLIAALPHVGIEDLCHGGRGEGPVVALPVLVMVIVIERAGVLVLLVIVVVVVVIAPASTIIVMGLIAHVDVPSLL